MREKRITGVACGFAHSMFLTEQKSIFGCGWNNDGQLGLDKTKEKVFEPVKLEL